MWHLSVQAIIMAGGEGVRLRPLTLNLPKPLVPLLGEPVMGYALKLLGCGEPQVYEDTLPCGETRTLILAEKKKPTPAAYPRPYAKIKQKPLKEKH